MSNELRPLRPMFETFTIRELPQDQQGLINSLNSFRHNGKAEIITQDSRGKYYVYSGEKISLQELARWVPENVLNQAIRFDKDQDGFITENELKEQVKKEGTGEKITKWALGGTMVGAVVGGFLKGGAVGAAAGAPAAGIGALPGFVVGGIIGAAGGLAIGVGAHYYTKSSGKEETGAYLQDCNWNNNRIVKTVL